MKHNERAGMFSILKVASQLETRLLKRRNSKGWRAPKLVWVFLVISFFALSAIFYFFGFVEKGLLASFILSFLVVFYISVIVLPVVKYWADRSIILEMFFEPMNILLGNSEITFKVDARSVRKLKEFSVESLELFYLEIKSEREFFEQRILAIIGPVEKIGLIPGIVAAGLSFYNMNNEMFSWVTLLACLIPVFYSMGMSARFLVMRLDRYAKVIDLAIKQKAGL